MKIIIELVNDGMEYKEAIKVVVRKSLLESFLDEVIDNE